MLVRRGADLPCGFAIGADLPLCRADFFIILQRSLAAHIFNCNSWSKATGPTPMGAEALSLREREDRERSAARSRQRLAEEEEDRRLGAVEIRGGAIYMTQEEAADHVAARLSLLQRWRGGDASAGQQLTKQERSRLGARGCSQRVVCERRSRRQMQRVKQGMPPISVSTMEKQQQHQQQIEQRCICYICFLKRSGLGAPVPVLGVSKRGALLTAQGGSCTPSGEGRVWVFCDAFRNANGGHVNLEALSARALALHQGVRGGRVATTTSLPALPMSLWRTEDLATSEALFLTQEWTSNDVNDDTSSEAPSDSSYFRAHWLPHDLV